MGRVRPYTKELPDYVGIEVNLTPSRACLGNLSDQEAIGATGRQLEIARRRRGFRLDDSLTTGAVPDVSSSAFESFIVDGTQVGAVLGQKVIQRRCVQTFVGLDPHHAECLEVLAKPTQRKVAGTDDHRLTTIRILESSDFRMEQGTRRIPEDLNAQTLVRLLEFLKSDKCVATGHRVDADDQGHRRLPEKSFDFGIDDQ